MQLLGTVVWPAMNTADAVCGLLSCCPVWHLAVAARRNILKVNFVGHLNHIT